MHMLVASLASHIPLLSDTSYLIVPVSAFTGGQRNDNIDPFCGLHFFRFRPFQSLPYLVTGCQISPLTQHYGHKTQSALFMDSLGDGCYSNHSNGD